VKNVWGLGAAVLSLLLLMVFWTVYVTGRLATTERLAPSETVDGIEVPVIGTVGDFPEPEHRHVVNVTADGLVVVEGARVETYRALVDTLLRCADRTPGDVIQGTVPPIRYGGAAVLRLDGSLPWGVVKRVVDACLESRMRPICFVVRHARGDDEGALTLSRELSEDQGSFAPIHNREVVVELLPSERRASPDALYAALRAARDRSRVFAGVGVFESALRVDAAVPTRDVLAVLDAAGRAGVTTLLVPWGHPNGSVRFDEEAARLRMAAPTSSIRVDGEPLSATADSMPPIVRVRGVAEAPRLLRVSDSPR
jgi:hypothetical protein